MMGMKCALAAAGFINGDIEYNKAVLADTLGKCAGKADAVIFGEAFLQGFDSLNFTAGHDMAVAVSREGRVIHELCQLAKEHAIAISFGFLEQDWRVFQFPADHRSNRPDTRFIPQSISGLEGAVCGEGIPGGQRISHV